MKDFKLSDLNITKADVSSLTGGICKCCVKIPGQGVAEYGAFAGCCSNHSVVHNPTIE